MASLPEHVMLTYEDLRALPNNRNRYEIIDGELVVTAAPTLPHQTAVINLGTILNLHVQRNELGQVLAAPCDVFLTDTSVVEPDLLYVSKDRSEILLLEHVRGAPDLVIEVTSRSTAKVDRQVKMKLYARFKVPYYWIFDPMRHKADAYGLSGTGYELIRTARGNEEFSAPPFPDLVIRLAQVWGRYAPKG